MVESWWRRWESAVAQAGEVAPAFYSSCLVFVSLVPSGRAKSLLVQVHRIFCKFMLRGGDDIWPLLTPIAHHIPHCSGTLLSTVLLWPQALGAANMFAFQREIERHQQRSVTQPTQPKLTRYKISRPVQCHPLSPNRHLDAFGESTSLARPSYLSPLIRSRASRRRCL